MAISRSFGSTSFMRFPSMKRSPELISSSPATMRRVVDFPQPEGPTKMINSLSSISRLKSFTATKPFGYFFTTFFSCTLAMPFFSFFCLPPCPKGLPRLTGGFIPAFCL